MPRTRYNIIFYYSAWPGAAAAASSVMLLRCRKNHSAYTLAVLYPSRITYYDNNIFALLSLLLLLCSRFARVSADENCAKTRSADKEVACEYLTRYVPSLFYIRAKSRAVFSRFIATDSAARWTRTAMLLVLVHHLYYNISTRLRGKKENVRGDSGPRYRRAKRLREKLQ